MSNRAALYLRSSKDRSDVSIDAQRRELHALAGARGLVVVAEFADAVESGKDDDRPAFQRLIAELKSRARGWEHVLVLDTSRVARRREISMMFERECKRAGVALAFKALPDTDPIMEMLLRSILQAMDEWHSLTSRQKGVAGMAENVRQGWRAGGRAPRGYRLEYHATGAIRDGAPVTKSKLVLDPDTAPAMQSYLRLRAQGATRGQAIARTGVQWPAESLHSADWQALTYAGHTVWGMHAEAGAPEKRRPRSEWTISRNTHPALISDDQAEAILRQMEAGAAGRRTKDGSRLLSGLLVAPNGERWRSDGGGFYRLGKRGRRVHAAQLEAAVLELVVRDLSSETAVARVLEAVRGLEEPRADGRTLAGLERRAGTLAAQIGRTVDLAAQADDPAPVLRRVADLEAERAGVLRRLDDLRAAAARVDAGARLTADDVRTTLAQLVGGLTAAAGDERLATEARLVLADLVERIELDPEAMQFRLCYAIEPAGTGSNVASPRGAHLEPVRWTGAAANAPMRGRRIA